jgi:NAD(P)-dependent dehydrogenase (short-subunit alcohol dehydrogenase family)
MTDITSSRVWFITGTSTGFGRALAEEILKRGERLVATARQPQSLADLERSAPDRVRIAQVDVTKPEEIQKALELGLSAFGQIDVLVNNAGYGLLGAFEESSDEQVRQQFETNVFGVFNVTRAILPMMRKQGHGHILNMSSVAGQTGAPGLGIYDASKFAVEGFSESLAQEVASLGIRVTLIEPGAFRTNWAGRSMEHTSPIEAYAQTAGYVRQFLSQVNGQQSGDPVRAAQAMIQVVESANPPLHLPLGADSLGAIRAKIEKELQEFQAWESVIVSTAYPQGE